LNPVRRARLGRGALLTAVFTLATVVMLRPWPSKISEGMPQNLGDSVLITWIMHWGFHALTTEPLRYFHGNNFWPAGNTLAYSDLLLPFVPVYGVFFTITGNWPLSTNLTVLTMVALCLGATYVLGRRLGASVPGATVAALAFTFTGFHLSEWGHVQLNTLGLLPLATYLTIRFLDERTWWTAVAAGVATASTLLAAVYFGLLWFLALGVLFGGHLVATRFRPGRRFWSGALLLGVVAMVLMGPALYKYAQQGERRGYEDYRGLKARDLVTPPVGSYLWGEWFTFEEAGYPALQEHGLYPGVTVVLLGAAGAVALRRRNRPGEAADDVEDGPPPTVSPDARRHLGLIGLAGLSGVILAIGPTAMGVPMPFRLFHAVVPGFSGIRVYTRLATYGLLALALLAGIGCTWLLARIRRRASVLSWVAAAVITGLVLLDLSAPIHFTTFPDDEATLAVYRRLEELPPGAVVEIPMVDASVLPAEWAYVEAPRMVHGTIGFRPRVNGYSATTPDTYWTDLVTFNAFPTPESVHRAYELRVRYVVLHVSDVTDHATFSEADAAARLAALPARARAERHGNSWLVDLGPVRPPDDDT
jgi:hypothetical protein